MLKITDDQLSRLRSLPIEGVAQRLGLKVERHVSLCPFHDDRHPSLHYNVSRNSFKCFVCDAHGGPIDLVIRHLNLSFVDACRWLADDTNIILSEYANHQTVEKKSYTFQADRYIRYFENPYLNRSACRFLFDERRLDPRVIRWCRLTSWTDRQGRNWLQIPYFDIDGHLTGIQWRYLKVNGSELMVNGLDGKSINHKPSTINPPRFLFPRGSKCHIYNLPVLKLLKPGDELYIAEGCSDCWSLLSSGHKAIAIPSATLLKPQDLEPLSALSSKLSTTFHMFPDADIPGERLFLQLKQLLEKPSTINHQPSTKLIRHSLPAGCKDYSDYYLSLSSKTITL